MQTNKIIVDKRDGSYIAFEVIANTKFNSLMDTLYGHAHINLYEVQDYEDNNGFPNAQIHFMGSIDFTSSKLTELQMVDGEKTSAIQPMNQDCTLETNFGLWYSPGITIPDYTSIHAFMSNGPAISKLLTKMMADIEKNQRTCEDMLWRYIGAFIAINIPQARYNPDVKQWAIVHNSAFKRVKPSYMR